jgi:TetR/AcrR family transcriptional repressor of nem operon
VGHSQAEKAQSRERILAAAARQIRESGLDSISIAELMKAAKLTHGGFYGHFPSRDALIAAAVERATERAGDLTVAVPKARSLDAVKSIVARYLSPAHRDDIGNGCAVAALAGDVGRLDDADVRAIMAKRVDQNFHKMAEAMGGGRAAKDAARAAWCTMIGAIVLSRLFSDDKRSDEILRSARRSVLDLEARARLRSEAVRKAAAAQD